MTENGPRCQGREKNTLNQSQLNPVSNHHGHPVSEDSSALLEPLLDLEHDLAPRHLELRRVLRPLRVHVGAVRRPVDEDGRRALAHVARDPQRVPRVDGPCQEIRGVYGIRIIRLANDRRSGRLRDSEIKIYYKILVGVTLHQPEFGL